MGERVLRGSRLGSTSYETDRDTELAPRRQVDYDCPRGHRIAVPMAEDAEVPATWECRLCGAIARRHEGGDAEEKKAGKTPRTHWDMLLERRSLDELEEILAERLDELHRGSRKSA